MFSGSGCLGGLCLLRRAEDPQDRRAVEGRSDGDRLALAQLRDDAVALLAKGHHGDVGLVAVLVERARFTDRRILVAIGGGLGFDRAETNLEPELFTAVGVKGWREWRKRLLCSRKMGV